MAPIDVQTSLENLKLERDAIVLYDALAADREGPAPRRRFRADRRQRAAARRRLGDEAPRARASTSRRPGGRAPGCRFIIAGRPALRDQGRRRPRPGARGRRGGGSTTPRGRRPRSRRSPPTSASTREIWKRSCATSGSRGGGRGGAPAVATAWPSRARDARRPRSAARDVASVGGAPGRCGRSSSASATAS